MATNFDMNWGDIKSNTGNVNFLQLQSGKAGNLIRIVSAPVELALHWEDGIDGKKRKIICSGANCPCCEAGHKVQKRFQMLAFNKNNWTKENGYSEAPQVQVLEVSKTVALLIQEFALDSDYGNPTKYDFKIKKEGSGLDTKYSVVASPNKSDLTEEEKEALANAPTLKEINKIHTTEELKTMGLKLFAGTDVTAGLGEEVSNIPSMNSDDDWENF